MNQGLYNSLVAVQKLKWDWAGQETPAETAKDLAERMTRVKLRQFMANSIYNYLIKTNPHFFIFRLFITFAIMGWIRIGVALLNTFANCDFHMCFHKQEPKILNKSSNKYSFNIKYRISKIKNTIS